MIILIANLGSTSFKYKLFDMAQHEKVLATGSADRIGQSQSAWEIAAGDRTVKGEAALADHAQAIELHLTHLVELGVIASMDAVQAIGFKAVHGGPISGAVRVDEHVLATMADFADVAPMHNPPYIAAMKAFAVKLPGIPQVAAFETAFHQTIPMPRQVYGIPFEWIAKHGIRRYGFHGASHRYIATRMAEIQPAARKIISCHLGGSCSVCAIEDGRSVANSFGMTTQSGVFHASRAGDFDMFASLKLRAAGISDDQILRTLGKEAGLIGLSGVSADMRDVQRSAREGNKQARLAVDAFVESVRHYVGAYLAVLNGADALVFTGGIGQHDAAIREAICANLDFAGIVLHEAKNLAARGSHETRIDAVPTGTAAQAQESRDRSPARTAIWLLPTNEELIVARQTMRVLQPATLPAAQT